MGLHLLVDEHEITAATCLSRVRVNLHARFLGEGAAVTLLPYPTTDADTPGKRGLQP